MPVQPQLNLVAETAAHGFTWSSSQSGPVTCLAGEVAGLLTETGNKTPTITWQQQSEGNRTPLNHRLTAHTAIHLPIRRLQTGGLLASPTITSRNIMRAIDMEISQSINHIKIPNSYCG